MCNLYSITRSHEAMRRIFGVKRDLTGNLPVLPAVYPDMMAPIVRTASDGERELVLMRWGFPPPPNLGKAPVTNVRNLKSPYWRGFLKAEWRCLVPATSFCEWTGSWPKVTHWFALDERYFGRLCSLIFKHRVHLASIERDTRKSSDALSTCWLAGLSLRVRYAVLAPRSPMRHGPPPRGFWKGHGEKGAHR
jgi:SOS response associated peptidase (SRAP)